MYSKSKYVVGCLDGTTVAVVFPESIQHSNMRALFNKSTSAGFCHYNEEGVSVYGESHSLKVKSLPEDAKLVAQAMSHPTAYV